VTNVLLILTAWWLLQLHHVWACRVQGFNCV